VLSPSGIPLRDSNVRFDPLGSGAVRTTLLEIRPGHHLAQKAGLLSRMVEGLIVSCGVVVVSLLFLASNRVSQGPRRRGRKYLKQSRAR
jgi:hypothetical protein